MASSTAVLPLCTQASSFMHVLVYNLAAVPSLYMESLYLELREVTSHMVQYCVTHDVKGNGLPLMSNTIGV